MPLFNKAELSISAQKAINFSQKSASDILQKSAISASEKSHDIFLSHRYLDAKYILGLKIELENLNYEVFVDWIEKPVLDRANVLPSTADWLRSAMRNCKCLLYAISDNSPESKWMPWELGFSDGIHGKVAMVPIADSPSGSETYVGQEYLGLYPYVTKTKTEAGREEIWINKSPTVYVQMRFWLKGVLPSQH